MCPTEPIEATEAYRTLQKAMLQPAPRTVYFTYTDTKGVMSQRHVEPYEIKGDTLFAWCLTRDALRRFLITEIQDITLGAPFAPRQKIVVPC